MFLSKKGDKLSMHYDVRTPASRRKGVVPPADMRRPELQGRLSTGKDFDSSRKRGQPFDFVSASESVLLQYTCALAAVTARTDSDRLCTPSRPGPGHQGLGAGPAGHVPGREAHAHDPE